MPVPFPATSSSAQSLVKEQSLRAHIILESWIQGETPCSSLGLLNFAYYLDTAWVIASKTLKSPPKVLADSRKLFRVRQNTGMTSLSEQEIALLCKGVDATDTIWARTPLPMLLDAMIVLRNQLGGPEDPTRNQPESSQQITP